MKALLLIIIMAIKSLFVCGNSYSATWGNNGIQRWPGMISVYGFGFPYVQFNNKAAASAMLFDNVGMTPPRPGLKKQLSQMRGPSAGSLLVIFLYPWGDHDFQPAVYTPEYDYCIGLARRMGFRKVLLPNHPDITKTAYMRSHYTTGQLITFRNQYSRFNSNFSTLIGCWRSRYPNVKFASVDLFNMWDGKGTVPDGLHPNWATHQKFAYWFAVASNTYLL